MFFDRRAPEARYLRAMTLREHWGVLRSNQRFEDPLTYSFAKFSAEIATLGHAEQDRYMAMRPLLSEVHQMTLMARDIWSAMGMRAPGVHQEEPRNPNIRMQHERSIIKALVVAGASTEFIAAQFGHTPELIATFEMLCWDVRSRLNSRAWLQTHLFATGIHREAATDDFERLVFHRAFVHGLEGVMDYLYLTGHIVDPRGYAKVINGRNVADIASKSTTGIQTAAYRGDTAIETLRTSFAADKVDRELELKERESDVGRGSPGEERILKSIVGLDKGEFTPLDPRVPLLDAGPEERRNSDVFTVALKQALKESNLVGATP